MTTNTQTGATTITRFTTAPEAYDGFGTKTIAIAGADGGKTVRKVEIQSDHIDWQECRYGSGCHGSLTESKWLELVRFGICQAA